MKYFTLSNKYFFTLTTIFLVFILTFINNYYFYSHIERSVKREAVVLEKILINYVKNNRTLSNNELEKNLLLIIDSWKKKIYYNKSLYVITLDKTSYYGNQPNPKWDYTAASKIEINIGMLINLNKNAFIVRTKKDFYSILKSVIKSMTFSISDVYKDIFATEYAPFKGVISSIEKIESDYDGLILINEESFSGEPLKNIVTITSFDKKDTKILYVDPYKDLKVQINDEVNESTIIYEGSILTAINKLNGGVYWLRSRPFIGFTIFTLLLLYIFNKRRILIENQHKKSLTEYENKIKEFELDINKITLEKEKLIKKQNKLEEEFMSVCKRFKEYENFVKFAFKDIAIEEMFKKNSRVLGTMFRLVAEKIVFSLYENKLGNKIEFQTLDNCLREIKDSNILSRKAINNLYAIKQFGNKSSHYSKYDDDTSTLRSIVIAKDLIEVIDEYLSLEV